MAVVAHPARHDRIDRFGEFGEGVGDPLVKPPAANLAAELLQGLGADRGRERQESCAVFASRRAWPEREPQERERGVFVVSRSSAVLAVHDLGLGRVQSQTDLFHPVPDRCQHLVSLAFGDTMRLIQAVR